MLNVTLVNIKVSGFCSCIFIKKISKSAVFSQIQNWTELTWWNIMWLAAWSPTTVTSCSRTRMWRRTRSSEMPSFRYWESWSSVSTTPLVCQLFPCNAAVCWIRSVWALEGHLAWKHTVSQWGCVAADLLGSGVGNLNSRDLCSSFQSATVKKLLKNRSTFAIVKSDLLFWDTG